MLLVALVVLSAGSVVHTLTAQPGSRLALTAALVEDGSIRIDDYRAITAEIDRIERDGHLYSDKAPGQPVLAVPFYAVGRVLGLDDPAGGPLEENLTLWWLTWWSSTVPAAVLVLLTFLAARRFAPRDALPAALAMFYGTMLLPLAGQLFGHVLAAALGFGAWYLASSEQLDRRRLVAVGALLGLAVATEYPLALVALAVVGALLWRGIGREIVWVLLAALPAAIALAVYQAAAFGSPLRTSYGEKADTPGSALEFGLPDPATLVKVVVGTRGLIWTPIVLVALAAAVGVARDREHPARAHGVMALLIAGAYLLLQSSWPNPWGGEVSFPRYTVTMLPFLVVPLATHWSRWRLVALVATAVGMLRVLPPLLIVIFQPHSADFVDWYRHALDEYGIAPAVLAVGLGPIGWIFQLGLLGLVAVLLTREARRPDPTPGPPVPVTSEPDSPS